MRKADNQIHLLESGCSAGESIARVALLTECKISGTTLIGEVRSYWLDRAVICRICKRDVWLRCILALRSSV